MNKFINISASYLKDIMDKKTLFTKTTKNINNLRKNLTRNVQNLFEKNFKLQLKPP